MGVSRCGAWALLLREAWDLHRAHARRTGIDHDPSTWRALALGRDVGNRTYTRLRTDQQRARAIADIDLRDRGVDVVLLPLSPRLPRPAEAAPLNVSVPAAAAADPGFTVLAGFARIPALALPIAVARSGAPIGIQLLARWEAKPT